MYQSSLNIKHRHKTHLYWGIDKTAGDRVRINEVFNRGLNCNCKCAACGGDFIARKGDKNKHHFAHQSNYECVYANEIAVYQEVKEVLEKTYILLPAISVSVGFQTDDIRKAWNAKTTELYYQCDPEQYPPLMVGKVDGRSMRIVLQFGKYYTYEDYQQFKAEAIRNNWDCLVIHFPAIIDEESLDCTTIREIVERGGMKQWIYNSVKAERNSRLLRAAVTPPKEMGTPWGDFYQCPIHAHWYGGKPLADEDDCYHCEFNYGVSPKCLCLAQQFIRKLSDLDVPAHERYQNRDALREANDQNHERAMREQEQREKMWDYCRMNQYYTPPIKPARTVCIAPSYEEQLRMGKLEVQEKFDGPADDLIYDRFNRRWLKCLICGEIKPEGEMAIYGGRDGLNKGTCRDCSPK